MCSEASKAVDRMYSCYWRSKSGQVWMRELVKTCKICLVTSAICICAQGDNTLHGMHCDHVLQTLFKLVTRLRWFFTGISGHADVWRPEIIFTRRFSRKGMKFLNPKLTSHQSCYPYQAKKEPVPFEFWSYGGAYSIKLGLFILYELKFGNKNGGSPLSFRSDSTLFIPYKSL